VDTAAGLSDSVTTFTQAAIMSSWWSATSPLPSPMPMLDQGAEPEHGVQRFQILANQTRRSGEGPGLFQKIERVCDRFLNVTRSSRVPYRLTTISGVRCNAKPPWSMPTISLFFLFFPFFFFLFFLSPAPSAEVLRLC